MIRMWKVKRLAPNTWAVMDRRRGWHPWAPRYNLVEVWETCLMATQHVRLMLILERRKRAGVKPLDKRQ